MIKLELLAPARDVVCGKAAIDHGADAVYIGANRFGARAAVGNSISDISELCDYAHRFSAKVYVTVNTIIYDGELDETHRLIEQLESIGVDAILIQDMAVWGMVKNVAKHASTQTDNRTVEKVRWLRDIGFRRVVLARELSVSEISRIHQAVPDVELEVFVHGALCVSYSGQCYASQYCFKRSANRGECAQFCRMKFDLVDSSNNIIERNRHLLSLKDMNQSGNIERLIDAGATSFKIEGRLKDIDYVKNVTAAYSRILDDIIQRNPDKYSRASSGRCHYVFSPELYKSFNRGFTTYFADGRRSDIASMDTPKAIGEYVGRVKEIRGNSFCVSGLSAFTNGDGLCFFNSNNELEGFRVNKVENNRLFPQKIPHGLRAGMRIYRNHDVAFERLLSKSGQIRKIPVVMSLTVVDEGFALKAEIKNERVASCVMPAEHQTAINSQRDNIVRQLSKLGNTIYECSEVVLPEDFDYFIPASILSEMRRSVIEKLDGGRKRTSSDDDRSSSTRIVSGCALPLYKNSVMYNISNKESLRFYRDCAEKDFSPAYELRQNADVPIMQCRYCLRHELGFCVKNGGRPPMWHEPLFLCLSDGRRFRLEFDCHNCQMNIYAR